MILYWSHPLIQSISEKNKEHTRHQKFPHRMGPINFARVRAACEAKGTNEEPKRFEMFIATCTNRKRKELDESTQHAIVRCTNLSLCSSNGASLVVTDYGAGDRTDFVMSPAAFSALGLNSTATDQLKKLGTVDIEYQRIPCSYPGQNIVIKIKESSTNPGYFSIVLLNVGGTCDVDAIQLSQSGSTTWIPLRRVDGAVFDISNPPSGPLSLRFQVDCGSGLQWKVPKNVIPANWSAGATYDTGIQF